LPSTTKLSTEISSVNKTGTLSPFYEIAATSKKVIHSTKKPKDDTNLKILKDFSTTEVSDSGVYSVGYFENQETTPKLTTTTSSPTTLDYTTPYTTAPKNTEPVSPISFGLKTNKGKFKLMETLLGLFK
jgi:hypothetical protein